MPDEADGARRLQRGDEAVEIRDVVDEVVERAGARPRRVPVTALIVCDGTAGQKRGKRVERPAVVEPTMG